MSEQTRDDKVLSFDPFDGDESEGVVTLKNRMVTTRKVHECHNCAEDIPVGTRVRSMSQTFEGDVGTWWWCVPCCDAMATFYDADDGDEDGTPTLVRRCKPYGRHSPGGAR